MSAGEYTGRIARLSARIFGNIARKATPNDMKVVDLFARKPYAYFANQYYPPMVQLDTLIRRLRARGLYKDEHMDFQELMYEQRKARGKGKPRKGEGKRQQKKKK